MLCWQIYVACVAGGAFGAPWVLLWWWRLYSAAGASYRDTARGQASLSTRPRNGHPVVDVAAISGVNFLSDGKNLFGGGIIFL